MISHHSGAEFVDLSRYGTAGFHVAVPGTRSTAGHYCGGATGLVHFIERGLNGPGEKASSVRLGDFLLEFRHPGGGEIMVMHVDQSPRFCRRESLQPRARCERERSAHRQCVPARDEIGFHIDLPFGLQKAGLLYTHLAGARNGLHFARVLGLALTTCCAVVILPCMCALNSCSPEDANDVSLASESRLTGPSRRSFLGGAVAGSECAPFEPPFRCAEWGQREPPAD